MLNQRSDICRMLHFARLWYRFGGGPAEDILVEFGMTERVFFGRLMSALEQVPAIADIDDDTRRAIRTVALERLNAPRRAPVGQ